MLSFVALGSLWKRPQLERRAAGRQLPAWLEPILRSPVLHFVLGAVSAGLLVLVFLTALIGERSPAVNLAPTFVYVVFWLGVPLLSILLGDVWRVLSPWRAAADAVAYVSARAGGAWRPNAAAPVHVIQL